MKEHIVTLLMNKVGLTYEKAEQVFEIVMTYIQEHPQHLSSYMSRAGVGSEQGYPGNFFN
ncbi:MAG: hypothetical protein AB1757_27050 [Acidobacteriota bacterium]